jgi:transcriptional regulator GlxA family with amidase domain
MFKKHTGVSPGQYHLHLRLMRAKELLLATDMSIKQVAYETGFESIHYFSRLYKSKMGVPPSEARIH